MSLLATIRSSLMPPDNLTVGELAKATATKAVTIRYYEQIGLLPAASRSSSGYRLYNDEQRTRLLFIRRSRGLGFSVEDIRELLGLADRREASCSAVDSKVQGQLEQVRLRIADLRNLEAELQRLSDCCQGGVIENCRIIETLSNRS